MKKTNRVLSLFLSFAIAVGTFGGTAAFATSSDDFDIENGVLVKYNGTDTNVIIPEGVTEIGKEAFTTAITYVWGLTAPFKGDSITSVYIPDGVKKIDEHAFAYCAQLTKVRLPDTSVDLGDGAFVSCNLLSDINFPNAAMTIGDSAFNGCSLTKADFGEAPVSIGDSAFSNCNKLTNVSGNNITSLGKTAFADCVALSTVNIPNSSLVCGSSVFLNCTSLKNVTLGGTQFGDTVFMGCGLSDFSVFHGTLKAIGPYMFESNKFTNIVIPSSVTSIGNHAFPDTMVESYDYVIIPDSVKTISDGAFPTEVNGGWKSYLSVAQGQPEPKPVYATIYGVAGSAAETYAKKSGNPFVAITHEQANTGKISGGSLTLDTTNYTMAPGNTYQIGAKAAGMAGTTVKCYSSSTSIAKATKLSNSSYQIKGIRSGTAYIMFDVMKGSAKVGHMSVRVDVKSGVKQHGDSKPCTLQLN